MAIKGRYQVLAWTAVFAAVAGSIVWRDNASFDARKRVVTVRREIDRLQANIAAIQSDIAAAESHQVLEPKVMSYGLRFLSDSDQTQLTLPVGH
jgi:hypothetical protein